MCWTFFKKYCFTLNNRCFQLFIINVYFKYGEFLNKAVIVSFVKHPNLLQKEWAQLIKKLELYLWWISVFRMTSLKFLRKSILKFTTWWIFSLFLIFVAIVNRKVEFILSTFPSNSTSVICRNDNALIYGRIRRDKFM